MRIKYQLFLTLLCASAMLIGLMSALNSWSFNRGFLNYINSVQLQRVDSLADYLTTAYDADNADWTGIIDTPEDWRSLVIDYVQNRGRRPMPPGPRNRTPEFNDRRATSDRRPPPGGRRDRAPIPAVLADSNQQVLFGPERGQHNFLWRSLVIDGGIIGYVGVPARNELSDDVDRVFSRQQTRSFTTAAIAMTFASALLALLLSSRIVKPLVRLKVAVSDISKGNYAHRVMDTRRDEFGDLAKDINRLAHTLEENLRARQQWIAEISHELRTPVAVLQSELEAMQDGIIQIDDAAVTSLHAEILRLSRLVDDLHELSLADVGALSYHMEDVNVADIIEARLLACESQLQIHAITPHCQATSNHHDLEVSGDKQRLEQLFDNLIQNSARYTDAGGTLDIVIDSDDHMVSILWQDSEPGVTDQQLNRLFDPLFRADDSRSREHGGAGLGLAIAQKVVDAHGGSMSASHSHLGGLSLSINLPARRH